MIVYSLFINLCLDDNFSLIFKPFLFLQIDWIIIEENSFNQLCPYLQNTTNKCVLFLIYPYLTKINRLPIRPFSYNVIISYNQTQG